MTNPGCFGPRLFWPGSFRPGSFRPNFGVGDFGLGRWVNSALGHFSPGSFRPKYIPKCIYILTTVVPIRILIRTTGIDVTNTLMTMLSL